MNFIPYPHHKAPVLTGLPSVLPVRSSGAWDRKDRHNADRKSTGYWMPLPEPPKEE